MGKLCPHFARLFLISSKALGRASFEICEEVRSFYARNGVASYGNGTGMGEVMSRRKLDDILATALESAPDQPISGCGWMLACGCGLAMIALPVVMSFCAYWVTNVVAYATFVFVLSQLSALLIVLELRRVLLARQNFECRKLDLVLKIIQSEISEDARIHEDSLFFRNKSEEMPDLCGSNGPSGKKNAEGGSR